MFKKLLTYAIYLIALGFVFSASAIAEEITVSGNGDGSSSSVSVNLNNSANVTQTNDAQVSNDVVNDANTGDNTASSNNGDASITTGDATSTTNVANQGINSNYADDSCGCIDNPLNLKISGNGTDSVNNIDVGVNSSVNVYQSNSAQITNNVNNAANTGYNTANNNNGNVVIDTGNALAVAGIKNKNINFGNSTIGSVMEMISVSISGNGDGSINLVKLLFDNSIALLLF